MNVEGCKQPLFGGFFRHRIVRLLTLSLFTFGFSVVAPPAADANPALSAKMNAERTAVLQGETKPLYVLIRLAAPEFDLPRTKRPPLNLSLVLDRSGSMSEKGKIGYLKEAAKMAIRQLGTRDTVSVVEFDDRITVLWPASPARRTEQIASQIDELSPRGSTDLAGGLQAGIEQADRARRGHRRSAAVLNRVLLLSDGLANTGITDHGAIARMSSAAREKAVRISTIGLGRDYDEDLMQLVAEAGGGKYYYVESPIQLARIFQEELKTAFTTRARDVRLTFRGTAAVHGAMFVGFTEDGRDATANLPDFYAGEMRSILLRLDLAANRIGPLDVGWVDIAWRDATSGARRALTLPIKVDVTKDAGLVARSQNRDVAVEASLAESERALRRNVKLYEKGKTEEARRANEAVIHDLKARNVVLKDERLQRKIEALGVEQSQMAAAAAAPEARQNYLKMTKQRLYQAKSGKRTGYVLRPGDKGLEVENLQRSLAKAGHYQGRITGIYDAATVSAVETYQRRHALDPDGVAGAATQQKLGLY